MLLEKDVWDLIETGPRPVPPAIWEQRNKENCMAVGTATRIIKEGVSDDIFNNIIGITDPREMWEKLRTVYSQVGQEVVYSILQELLNYLRNTKPKGFEKSVMSIFADVRFLVKRLQSAITPNRDIWDSIAIVVALDSLHDDFETATASMLERGDKTIKEIETSCARDLLVLETDNRAQLTNLHISTSPGIQLTTVPRHHPYPVRSMSPHA